MDINFLTFSLYYFVAVARIGTTFKCVFVGGGGGGIGVPITLFRSWELSCIAKNAVQPDRAKGFLSEPLAATLWLMSDHGAQLWWKGQLYQLIPTHPVNISCGRKPDYPKKPTTFGRALTDSFH
jgi:hypothetical protein